MLDDSYKIVWTIDDWVASLKECFAEGVRIGLDFETGPNRRWAPPRVGKRQPFEVSALRPEDGAKVCGPSLAWITREGLERIEEAGFSQRAIEAEIKSVYCPIRHDPVHAGGKQPNARQVMRALGDYIRDSDPSQLIVVHNLAMELQFLLAEGACWPAPGQIHDLMIAARVLNKGVGFKERIGLKPLQAEYLKRDMGSKNEMDVWLRKARFKKGVDIWRSPAAIGGWYAQDDSRDTLIMWVMWERYVYQPPTRWWWYRAPDKARRFDLYEMEIETAINAITNSLRGTRFDLKLSRYQAKAAEVLQDVARRWIREYMDVPTLNPGSATQLRGILFGDMYGLEVSIGHLTDAFQKLREVQQAKVLRGLGDKPLVAYASLDIEALGYYATQMPQHADLMFMLAVYRKCTTAQTWFHKTVLSFGRRGCPDPWWHEDDPEGWLHLLFHRLRTVGTISGRMSSSDYNGQQVPKRFKMLIDAARLFAILEEFLPESQLKELFSMLVTAEAKDGDEAKVLKVEAGAPVVDFSVRRMLIARPGYNMRLQDLSQVEFRGFAHFSRNAMLCEGYGNPLTLEEADADLAFMRDIMDGADFKEAAVRHHINVQRHKILDERPFDIHAFVANQLGITRKPAKSINFGIVYGMGKKKLARSLGWTVAKGKVYLARYYAQFPEILVLQTQIKRVLRERGYVFDPFGRRYYLPINRAYVGLNRLVQGWASSVFKVGFLRTCELFQSPHWGGGEIDHITRRPTSQGARVLSCIHDENMSEILKELDTPEMDFLVRTCMTSFHGLRVPLGTSTERSIRVPGVSNGSWDEAEEIHEYIELGAA